MWKFLSLILVLLSLVWLDLSIGSTLTLSPVELFHALRQTDHPLSGLLFQFRIPKTITAILAGAALSISGLQMQTLFRNPLAGPYVLGISSGASLGVAIVVLGFSSFFLTNDASPLSSWTIAIAAWLGSGLVLIMVLSVSLRLRDIMTVLILGILFASITSAIVSILQFFSSESLLKAFVIWTMGSLGSLTSNQLGVFIPSILAGILLSFFSVKSLNLFLLGEDNAKSLGINPLQTRILVFSSTSLLAGTVTAFCGPLAFIGIAVPHLARLVFQTPDHKTLIPGVILIGAILLLISDIITQIPGMGGIIPINAITALMGIPIVIWIVIKNQRFTGYL
jgi:iron complex transport system permease protein